MNEIIILSIVFVVFLLVEWYAGRKAFLWITEEPKSKDEKDKIDRLFRVLIVGITSVAIGFIHFFVWQYLGREIIKFMRRSQSLFTTMNATYVLVILISLAWVMIAIVRHYATKGVTKILPAVEARIICWMINGLCAIFAIFALKEAFILPDGAAGLIVVTLALIVGTYFSYKWWFPKGQNQIGVSLTYIVCCTSTMIIVNEFGWNSVKSLGGFFGMTMPALFNVLLFFLFVVLGDPEIQLHERKGYKWILRPWAIGLLLFAGFICYLQASGEVTWVDSEVNRAATSANQSVEILERELAAAGLNQDMIDLEEAIKNKNLPEAKRITKVINEKRDAQNLIPPADSKRPRAIEERIMFVKSYFVKFGEGKWKREHRFTAVNEEWQPDIVVAGGDEFEIKVAKGSVTRVYGSGETRDMSEGYNKLELVTQGGSPLFRAKSANAEIYLKKR